MFQSEFENMRSLIQQKNEEIESLNSKCTAIISQTEAEVIQLQERYSEQMREFSHEL